MQTELGREYIERVIESLVSSVGLKDPAPCRELEGLARRGDVKGCVVGIAGHLGLPVQITLSKVPKGYRTGRPNFGSRALSTVDEDGHGASGITAQVMIPRDLPPFGSRRLRGFPIPVRISEDATENPTSFLSVMAHELSHVLLHSLTYPDRDDEFHTDLTAMLLGFAEIMRRGRTTRKSSIDGSVVTTETTTYGYLSDDDFKRAFKMIVNLRSSRCALIKKVRKILNKLRHALDRLSSCRSLLIRYVAHIDARPPTRMSPEHAKEIALLHSSGYMDALQIVERRASRTLQRGEEAIAGVANYSDNWVMAIRQIIQDIENSLEVVAKTTAEVLAKKRVVRRYAGVTWRLHMLSTRRFHR